MSNITILPPQNDDERAALTKMLKEAYWDALLRFEAEAQNILTVAANTAYHFAQYKLWQDERNEDGLPYPTYAAWANDFFTGLSASTYQFYREVGAVMALCGVSYVPQARARKVIQLSREIANQLGDALPRDGSFVDADAMQAAFAIVQTQQSLMMKAAVVAASDLVGELRQSGTVTVNGESIPMPDEPSERVRVMKRALADQLGNARTALEDALDDKIQQHSKTRRVLRHVPAKLVWAGSWVIMLPDEITVPLSQGDEEHEIYVSVFVEKGELADD